MPAPHVSVIIVNWNGRRLLETCLPAALAQDDPDVEVVVVDNGSSDGSVAWLAAHYPQVRVLPLGSNLGFAAANNRGIAATEGRWVALLNNDAIPDPGWLKALVAAGERASRIGAVASRMVFIDRPEVINSAGIAIDPVGIAWDWLGGQVDRWSSADATEAGPDPIPVFGASAGAALYRREALEDVAERSAEGGTQVFDEAYFMYLEDVDLAWRLRLRGWDAVLAPGARVRHAASGTSGEGSPFKNRLLARNKVWTVLKDYPTAPMLARLPLIALYDWASAPYRLLAQGQTAAIHGRLEAWKPANLRRVLAQRSAIQARRSASWSDIAALMQPLASPLAVLSRYRHLAQPGRSSAPVPAPTSVPDPSEVSAPGRSGSVD